MLWASTNRSTFPTVRLKLALLITVPLISSASCGIPGIRPEGRTQSVSASAPASSDLVYLRAKRWYGINGYSLSEDVADQRLRGYKTLRREGSVETRAVVSFTITGGSANATSYRVDSRTEIGTPPVMRTADSNATEATHDEMLLQDFLSCSAAHWPGCP